MTFWMKFEAIQNGNCALKLSGKCTQYSGDAGGGYWVEVKVSYTPYKSEVLIFSLSIKTH